MPTKRGIIVVIAVAGMLALLGMVVPAVAAVAPPFGTDGPALPLTALGAPYPGAANPAAAACGGLPGFSAPVADQIMAGKLTISPFPTATIDPHHEGDINWNQNPYSNPTWQQTFQSGSWIEMLISGYLAGGPQADAYLARAQAITKGWLAGVPVGDRDPQVLICISEGFPGQQWIDSQIVASVDWLAQHWQGAWNHGLVQDLKLMRIGCAYPPTAFGGAALGWRQTAYSQILDSFQPNRLGPSIDTEGAVNEQATGYERFVYDLWRGGLPQLAACGYTLPASILARIRQLPAFLAAATQPDGDLVQIGDTYVESAPSRLPRPGQLVSVYDAGYAFGRDKWGPDGTFYSLRFGPGRQVHGHDDHMSITYYSRGRNLIVNAGHTGYEVSAYRDYLQSPEAASMLIAPGQKFRASAPTTLVASTLTTAGQYYQFSDYAFGGPRNRSVYVHDGPDFMLVLDRSAGAHTYQQLWHLDPGLAVARVTATSATATAPAIPATATSPAFPATALVITQIPLPGQAIPSGSTTVVKGKVNPYQGWVSHQQLERIPAPVVIMTSKGAGAKLSTTMLTLVAATAPGAQVTASVVKSPASSAQDTIYVVTVRIGATRTTLQVTPSTGSVG
ncbi:MAG TPA: heparinase II/III family protein [Trebonia sp.]|nr:heparinase II/III family protein [Trebonia sp.]